MKKKLKREVLTPEVVEIMRIITDWAKEGLYVDKVTIRYLAMKIRTGMSKMRICKSCKALGL
jgi:hypothetical protein